MTADLGRILAHIAAFAVLLAAGAFLLGGARVGLGALVGGAVAVVNWAAWWWLARRIVSATPRQRAATSVLMAFKLGALGVLCWALVVHWGVNPLGFLVGVSAFVLGILAGSLQGSPAVKEEG